MTLPSPVGGRTTTQVGFFETQAEELADWIREGFDSDGFDGPWVSVAAGWSSLADALVTLAPSPVVSRHACIPVVNWTALLTDGPLGTDVGVLPSYAARELGCRAIRAVCTADDETYPARVLEVFGPDGEPPLAFERSIVAANDSGRWVFRESGARFAFEVPEAYVRRKIASRFTPEMLIDYLLELGVPADADPDWHAARLVQLRG